MVGLVRYPVQQGNLFLALHQLEDLFVIMFLIPLFQMVLEKNGQMERMLHLAVCTDFQRGIISILGLRVMEYILLIQMGLELRHHLIYIVT